MSQSLSGRAAAQARRQAQTGGANSPKKSNQRKAVAQTVENAPIPTRAQQRAMSYAPVAAPVSRAPVATASADRAQVGKPVVRAEGREAAQKRRQAQLRGNRGYQQAASKNLHPKAKAMEARATAKAEAQVEAAPAPKVQVAVKPLTPTRGNDGRNTVKNDVKVKSNPGRSMSRAYRQARTMGKVGESAYKSKGSQAGAIAKMSNPEASSREIARTVRTERCSRGKTCGTAQPSSAGRTRKSRERSAPEKVGHSTTLSGQGISGTLVGQGKMTGAETGACLMVSGTEYFSSEEFNTHCESAPQAGKPKVTRTQTTKGETISGTTVGNANEVTGDRAGACKVITGTDYLPADQSELFCGTGAKEPKKVTGFSINATQANNTNASKVTGGDSYKSNSVTIRPAEPKTPRKVMSSMTAMGNMTTGTQVGRLQAVTGDERGYCQNVSGTGYQGAEEVETVCDAKPVAAPIKVTLSNTTRGQSITGDRSGETTGMTGAEAGTCKAVTGTPYMSFEHSSSCGIKAKAEIQHRMMGSIMPGKQALTGVQPGPSGLTGAQKGACELVSGTPYQGIDQTAAVCGGRASASQPGESDFPQLMNRAAPVAPVSAPQMMMQAPAVAMPQAMPAAEVEVPKQGASRITGDGWDRGSKVTGTEGEWVTKRNPSLRGGQAPATVMGAHSFRPNAMPEVPLSKITGSSGNADTGAKVTLSGGARA